MTPRSDVCALCEDLRGQIRASKTEEEKLDAASKLKSHIEAAQAERQYYCDAIEEVKMSLEKENPPSFTHLTFDFAENFVIPQHSRQPGPVYFKVMFQV